MKIETFYFNPYRECTYLLINDQQQAVIIDAGMYETREQQRFAQYIQSHQLTPIALLITHAHPDHVCGQEYIEKTYGLSAIIRPAEGQLPIERFDILVISTPGHKEDCVCYYLPKENIIFTGDTLFQESIGRTDLPGGDMHELILSLRKLIVLPEETKVYPGHGPYSTVDYEKTHNPFLL